MSRIMRPAIDLFTLLIPNYSRKSLTFFASFAFNPNTSFHVKLGQRFALPRRHVKGFLSRGGGLSRDIAESFSDSFRLYPSPWPVKYCRGVPGLANDISYEQVASRKKEPRERSLLSRAHLLLHLCSSETT